MFRTVTAAQDAYHKYLGIGHLHRLASDNNQLIISNTRQGMASNDLFRTRISLFSPYIALEVRIVSFMGLSVAVSAPPISALIYSCTCRLETDREPPQFV